MPKLKVNKLQKYRKATGMSQEALAEKVNVTRQTIHAIENNKYLPSLPLALKLSKIFKVNVEDLFS